ncbi:MAG: DUF3298 domain-containing protein [Thermoanaerobaculales bacterium]|jgi:hypothetical protein|nr:DUF3298 domain-containing protein [Thermoanaerobaculales bacterium]
MPRLIPAIVSFVLITGCGGADPVDRPPVTETTEIAPVVFTSETVMSESDDCDDESSRCARVEVATVATHGGGTEETRDNIDLFVMHDLISRLRSFVPEEIGNPLTHPQDLADAFIAQYRAFIEEWPESAGGWFVKIDTGVVYNTGAVCTLCISERAYTGGAHPNSRQRLVSFDVGTGQLLGVNDLTRDPAELARMATQRLRIDHDLEPDGDLATAGFWIPEGGLELPDNVGVVGDGLLIHWDPYEIAPYSMGPIDVIIPVDDLRSISDRRDW